MSEELKDIGAQMANVMFNLAQLPGERITYQQAETFNKLRKQWDAAVRATPPSPSTAPMCERKTAMLEGEGYAKTGYVLKKAGERICVSDGGAVSWFTLDQWNWLMFNRDHVEFQWPKPIGAAPIAEGELPLLPAPDVNELEPIGPPTAFSDRKMRAYGQECARAADASKPAARESARQSIDTPEFRALFRGLITPYGKVWPELIAHIDTWGGAALAANTATQKE